MIKFIVESKSKMLEGLEAFVEEFDDIAYEQFVLTFEEIKDPMLSELRYKPGRPVYPIDWTSEKQMKAFFASDGFGAGIPTRRTGKHSDAWIAKTERDGDRFVFIVDNPLPTAKFIYGSLARNRASAIRFQQRFHRKTGWDQATDTVKFWTEAFSERYLERMRKIAKTKMRKRAITR